MCVCVCGFTIVRENALGSVVLCFWNRVTNREALSLFLFMCVYWEEGEGGLLSFSLLFGEGGVNSDNTYICI